MGTTAHNSEEWVLFSDVLKKAGNLDAGTANAHADRVGIERTTLPDHDARNKYIRLTDVPRLLGCYTRPNPETTALLLSLTKPGNPDNNAGEPDKTPSPTPTKKQGRNAGKPGQVDGESRAITWGYKLAGWLASPLVAYLALIVFAFFQAWLHKGAAVKILELEHASAFGLMLMVQSVIVLGTVNSSFWKDDSEFTLFLWGFFVYDLLMVAGNFFYDFNPTLSSIPTNSEKLQMFIQIVFRAGLSVGFPLAQVFFAKLVKRFT